MTYRDARTVKLLLLTLAIIAGGVILTGLSAAATHAPDGVPGGVPVSSTTCGPAPEAPPADDAGAAPAPPNDEPDGTAAACRKAPECSIDSDCDAICGVGLGHCVHSSCPVRICKCR